MRSRHVVLTSSYSFLCSLSWLVIWIAPRSPKHGPGPHCGRCCTNTAQRHNPSHDAHLPPSTRQGRAQRTTSVLGQSAIFPLEQVFVQFPVSMGFLLSFRRQEKKEETTEGKTQKPDKNAGYEHFKTLQCFYKELFAIVQAASSLYHAHLQPSPPANRP